MTIENITDHAARTRARLLQQFKDKERVEAVLDAISAEVQEIEDVFFKLITERQIDTAIGQQLDEIGEIVGQKRNGLSDVDYRVRLKVRIQRNASNATPNEILDVMSGLINITSIEYFNTFPATFFVQFEGDMLTDDAELFEAVLEMSPSGVEFYLVQFDDPPMVFLDDPDPNGEGLGTVLDAGVGGLLARIVGSGSPQITPSALPAVEEFVSWT